MSNLGMSYEQIINSIDNKVNKAIKLLTKEDVSVVYAAYSTDEWDKPIDNLKDIPIHGKVKFINDEFESQILDSPTWLVIAIIANKMLNKIGDYQNKYLKDVEVIENKNGIFITKFIMGDY